MRQSRLEVLQKGKFSEVFEAAKIAGTSERLDRSCILVRHSNGRQFQQC